jgi:hypothetical protein
VVAARASRTQVHRMETEDHVQALRDVRSTLNFDLDDKVSQRVVGFRAFVFYP